MDGFTWTAFACYLLGAVGAAIFGLMYMARQEFMPYHGQAIGKTWAELDDRLKTLLLALIRSIGVLSTALGISTIAILFFAFISRELWSYYTIPLVELIGWGAFLGIPLVIKKKTGAKTPYMVGFVGIVLVVIGFVLSFF